MRAPTELEGGAEDVAGMPVRRLKAAAGVRPTSSLVKGAIFNMLPPEAIDFAGDAR